MALYNPLVEPRGYTGSLVRAGLAYQPPAITADWDTITADSTLLGADNTRYYRRSFSGPRGSESLVAIRSLSGSVFRMNPEVLSYGSRPAVTADWDTITSDSTRFGADNSRYYRRSLSGPRVSGIYERLLRAGRYIGSLLKPVPQIPAEPIYVGTLQVPLDSPSIYTIFYESFDFDTRSASRAVFLTSATYESFDHTYGSAADLDLSASTYESFDFDYGSAADLDLSASTYEALSP